MNEKYATELRKGDRVWRGWGKPMASLWKVTGNPEIKDNPKDDEYRVAVPIQAIGPIGIRHDYITEMNCGEFIRSRAPR